MTTNDLASSPILNISISDSFLVEQSVSGACPDEDLFTRIDDRINQKIALGLKKTVGLLVRKFSDVI